MITLTIEEALTKDYQEIFVVCFPACHHMIVFLHVTIWLFSCISPYDCFPACHHMTVFLHVTIWLFSCMSPYDCFPACHHMIVFLHVTIWLFSCMSPYDITACQNTSGSLEFYLHFSQWNLWSINLIVIRYYCGVKGV